MKNNEEEFLEAYEQYADAIFRYCYARMGERERAKDAVQETFHRAWKWLLKGHRAKNMRALLYRMATNITIDEYRRPSAQSLDALADLGVDVADRTARDPLLSAQEAEVIAIARKLDPKYRDPLLMRYIDDLPVKDIATVLGESENTTSVRIHRALKQLRELMNPDHE